MILINPGGGQKMTREKKELLDARKSKKLAEALTDKTVKILKYGSEYTVITGEEKIQDAVDCGWEIVE